MATSNSLAGPPQGEGAAGAYASLFTQSPAEQLRRFADMRSLYPTRSIARGERMRELAPGAPLELQYEADGRSLGVDEFMQRGRCAGLLLLHRGRVVLERYALGNTPDTRWISFSMAKSITSTLIGAALHDGLIDSLDEAVIRTVPQLRGSAYDGVTIRHVLQMSSGVRWVETYLDPESDRRRLLQLQSRVQPGAVIEYLRTLPRAAEPGSHFNYNTAETFLLGAILAGAIRRPLSGTQGGAKFPPSPKEEPTRSGRPASTVSDYLSEKIWQPCGMQSDAYWQLESEGGQEFAGSGLSACLRDYARFGTFVLGDGVVDGVRVLPQGWIAESTAVVPGSIYAPGKLPGFEPLGYGYQWWTFPAPKGRRVFGALGIFGQQIYVDVDAQLVIVLNSAWPEPVHEKSRLESYAFFDAATRALRGR
jgi:CubicO group peptidase (beta-lactamase class C family)